MAEASFARARKSKRGMPEPEPATKFPRLQDLSFGDGNAGAGEGDGQQGDVDGTNSRVSGGSLDGLELSTASNRQRNRRRRKRMMAGGASNKV